MNAKSKTTTPRKPRADAKSKAAVPAAVASDAQQASPVAAAETSLGASVVAGLAPSSIPEKELTHMTYTSNAKTKKGEYHALLSTNMVGVASEVAKAARVPFKELGLLSAFAVDKRYAVKTGNRTYVVMQPKAVIALKAGKDLMVTPLDAEFVTSGISDFNVAPPTPKQLAKAAKAEKRAAKKAENKLTKPNGAKLKKSDKNTAKVLSPQATFHPHPPAGGVAQ